MEGDKHVALLCELLCELVPWKGTTVNIIIAESNFRFLGTLAPPSPCQGKNR